MQEFRNDTVTGEDNEKNSGTALEIDEQQIHGKPRREDDSEYPPGLRFGLICVALCMSVFLMALDTSIIATAIPKITDEFQSLGDVGWYGSGKSPQFYLDGAS